jgi:hypothetical protein
MSAVGGSLDLYAFPAARGRLTMGQAFPAPTFGHAAGAFLIAHAAPGAWSAGTAVKYRQTLTALGGQLDGAGQAAASDVAMLGTPAGASALEAAFTAAFGQLASATRARHLSALRSALAWWAEAGWVTADPTAGWARPKVPVDTRPHHLQGRHDRLGPLADRHRDAAAPAAGRAARGPGVPDRPQAGPRGRLWRPLPGHQASEAVLPAGR